jgi:ribonuclease HII
MDHHERADRCVPNKGMPAAAAPTFRYLGSDEAGYGPSIGPLVVCTVAFDSDAPREDLNKRLWDLGVADSKQLYKAKKINRLEAIALAGLTHLTGWQPQSIAEARQLTNQAVADLEADPWLGVESCLPLAAEPLAADAAAAWQALPPGEVRISLVEAHQLNANAQQGGNRHQAEWQALSQHWQSLWHADRSNRLICDRLGGRRHYQEPLQDLFKTHHVSEPELIERGVRHQLVGHEATHSPLHEISFATKSDQHDGCCALASCIAKYFRELAMHQFNQYWTGRIRTLLPTAGYPADAKRFRFQLGTGLFSAFGERFWRFSGDEIESTETIESI